MLLFTLAISVIAGVGFGLAPALATTRTDVAATLKQGALTPLRGYRRFGLRNLLVVYQVAASLTLLLITGYIVFGYGKAARIDPGFDTSNLSLYQLDPATTATRSNKSPLCMQNSRIACRNCPRSVPLLWPMLSPFGELDAVVPNAHFSAPGPRGEVLRDAIRQRIGLKYFATLGVPLMRGRELQRIERQDSSGAIPVLLNETAALDFFGQDGPLGHTLRDDLQLYRHRRNSRYQIRLHDGEAGSHRLCSSRGAIAGSVRGSGRALRSSSAAGGANTIADVTNAIASLRSASHSFQCRQHERSPGPVQHDRPPGQGPVWRHRCLWIDSGVYRIGGCDRIRSRSPAQGDRHPHGAGRARLSSIAAGDEGRSR